jgi:hypothetical protein
MLAVPLCNAAAAAAVLNVLLLLQLQLQLLLLQPLLLQPPTGVVLR